jgi:hypothetical protein
MRAQVVERRPQRARRPLARLQSSERAQAAIARAYAQGVAELDAIRNRKETP